MIKFDVQIDSLKKLDEYIEYVNRMKKMKADKSFQKFIQDKVLELAKKVTDERLLEKTGGIIQGMSGAPIIQNGKFIGAVTHVLVNDSTVGYGVFADNMIKQLKEVN